MADAADRSDERIQHAVDAGWERAKRAMENPRLRPIVQVLDNIRFGVCHFCESEIQPGHLFCPTDEVEPDGSCAVLWEHQRKRKEDMGL